MIAMQYKIQLPDDYDMDNIRQRVLTNGNKTDGFEDLLFKAYLITEKNSVSGTSNEYSPLYLWNNNKGMNKFIFDGFYNNILNSFGWQNINIGIPLIQDLSKNFKMAKFALEIEKIITPNNQMENLELSLNPSDCVGKILIYNPDKWRYVEYYFFETKPDNIINNTIYEILHLST